jgi:hypothetical protein
MCVYFKLAFPLYVAAWRGFTSLARRFARIILRLAGLAKATQWLGFLLPTG